MNRRAFLRTGIVAGSALALPLGFAARARIASAGTAPGHFPVTKTDAEWRRDLTPAQYNILRAAGTETPESSPLDHEKRKGSYACAGCAQDLYRSDTKFDSGTGWPSFWKPIDGAVGTTQDNSLFMARTEVHCSNCGGHLGHVFKDGPPPTGLRYCMNGAAMVFKPA